MKQLPADKLSAGLGPTIVNVDPERLCTPVETGDIEG